MTLSLVRVDDRIIHGQITTRWSKVKPVHGIIAVGDFAHDELRKKVLKAAAGSYKVGIFPTEEAADKIETAKNHEKPYFLISNSPQTFAKLVSEGVDIGDVLNVGPMNTRDGAKVLKRTVAIDQADYDAFELLEANGVEVQFQLLPDDTPTPWSEMKAIYDSK